MIRAVNTATLDHEAVRESLEHIAAHLRPADAAEVAATTSEDPFWAIYESWEGSTVAWLILDASGLPVGIFGVAPHAALGVGIVWLLGTPELGRGAFTLARQTRHFVAQMQDLYPILWANVDGRNDASLQWLAWAGFALIDADPAFGPEERLFLQYVRTR